MAALADPIVGREVELAELDAMLGAPTSAASTCVAIEGEPGIGKTRLLSELRLRAEANGWHVFSGAAAEFERDLPFGVWADALDAYVVSRARDLRAEWPQDVVSELARCCRRCVLPASGAGSRCPTSATAATGRSAGCSRCWPARVRSC